MNLDLLRTLATSKPEWQIGRRQIHDSPGLWSELMGVATCDPTALRGAVLSRVQELFEDSPTYVQTYVHWATVLQIIERKLYESRQKLPVRQGLQQQRVPVAVPSALVNRVARDVKREYDWSHPSDANPPKPLEFFEIPDDVYQDKLFAAKCVRDSSSVRQLSGDFIAVLYQQIIGADNDPVALLNRVAKDFPSVDRGRFVIEFIGAQEE
ncbi:MAG UNVERIFIED_CONTAM: hypothetical protein LVR18_13205 [Planctomycetaceae bacterium]|jgi:hypothetical protein